MKKIFTLAAAVLASFSLYAADVTIALTSMTAGTGSYSYEGDEVKAKNNNVYIELPSAGIKGQITIFGSSNKDDRFLYIYGQAGTVKDETRAIVMANAGVTINYTQEDIITVSEKPYLLFSTSNDFKFKKFNYTYEADKEVDHVVETLTGAAINGVALDEMNMSRLINHGEFEDPTFYVEAPTVTFTVQMDTYYVGEETPSTKSEGIDVVAELVAGMWEAQLTINNETTYTIKAAKPETRTITYMDGETVLGTEVVAQGDPSTKHAEFETKPLAKFEGWFRNSDFTSQIDIESYVINEDQTLYGKFVKAYAQSLNIEQLVLDNGKGANIDSILLARGYEFANIDQLDSLNDEKDNRNYPYLGLKLKKEGAYVGFNLQAGSTAKLRFGNVAAPFVIEVNGENDTITADAANIHTDSIKTEEYIAEQDVYIRIRCLEEKKTIVIKQIMINEEIATVTLPGAPVVEPTLYTVTLNEPVYGTLSFAMTGADGKFAEGDTVRLSVVPEDGYYIDDVTAVGSKIETGAIEVQAANDGTYYFVMPADDVTVEAIIEEFPAVVETYTVTLAEAEHGRLSFALVGATGEFEENIDVPVLATPDDGYKVGQVTIGNEVLIADAEGVYHFTMPAYDVTVTATFVPESEGIEDVNAAKAVKRLENGMLLIEKNGKTFNVMGARIK